MEEGCLYRAHVREGVRRDGHARRVAEEALATVEAFGGELVVCEGAEEFRDDEVSTPIVDGGVLGRREEGEGGGETGRMAAVVPSKK